ncbi:MAG: hypothetical protein PHY92_01215 [Alphaproteobacteria bacterium]|nr:hypothetical protein [Alphaproteobacteria bacterium]
MQTLKVFAAFVLAIAGYAIWYKFAVHEWCPAMWHGAMPYLFAVIGTLGIYQLLNFSSGRRVVIPLRSPIGKKENAASHMPPWAIESNAAMQTLLLILMAVAGLLLVNLGAKGNALDFAALFSRRINGEEAAFLLGVLLVGIACMGLLFGGKRVIVVDPNGKNIIVKDANIFGKKEQSIAFDNIAEMFVDTVGAGGTGGSRQYDVVLRLRTGGLYRLFGKAYFDGRFSRAIMEERLSRIAGYLSTDTVQRI